MTPRSFCQHGEWEVLKGGVHVALLLGVATCAVYNGAAWVFRRERHLAVNTAFYTAVGVVEVAQIVRHVRGWTRA